jgi:hypothetical protein
LARSEEEKLQDAILLSVQSADPLGYAAAVKELIPTLVRLGRMDSALLYTLHSRYLPEMLIRELQL